MKGEFGGICLMKEWDGVGYSELYYIADSEGEWLQSAHRIPAEGRAAYDLVVRMDYPWPGSETERQHKDC